MCKVACGRKAAPGKTRRGKPFDTCCKGCIMGFGHDLECEERNDPSNAGQQDDDGGYVDPGRISVLGAPTGYCPPTGPPSGTDPDPDAGSAPPAAPTAPAAAPDPAPSGGCCAIL